MRVLGVVSKFFKMLFQMGANFAPTPSFTTISKVCELFQYGRDHGCQGLSLSEDEVKGPMRLIDWQADAKDWTILVASSAFDVGDKIAMLLVEETAEKYSAQIKILYEGLPDRSHRLQNKEHLEDE
jgi:hypothetical protein